MMRITAVAALFDGLREIDVLTWVERGWVLPEEGPVFHDIDVARVRLIHELLFRMDLREDAVPLILSLLDQVYELRGSLHAVMDAIEGQPAQVREAILAGLRI
jgi:chaperone modulatory protein CbpM